MPLAQATEQLEFEDIFSTFDPETRRNSQAALEGFGNAFAGRGNSLNSTIVALNPLFASLTPVMQNLSDPETQLDQFFRQIGRASAQVAPIATRADRPLPQHGHHLRGLQPRRRRAAGHDREVPAHDRHGDPLLPGAAALPHRLHRPLPAPAPGGERAPALAARHQPRLRRRHAACSRARSR
ncbi:MAG: hypothetical protein WKF40_05050 [Thermoleophilaceae bacterium]